MGRKSKLSEKEWDEIQKRLINGEPIRAIAREYDITESSIRAKKSARVKMIKTAANQIVAAECAIKSLPDFDARNAAQEYAARLNAISSNIMAAAYSGSVTSANLSAIASQQSERVDKDNPMGSEEELQAISALTKIGNEASMIAMAIIKANQDAMAPKDSRPVRVTFKTS